MVLTVTLSRSLVHMPTLKCRYSHLRVNPVRDIKYIYEYNIWMVMNLDIISLDDYFQKLLSHVMLVNKD